MWCGRIFIALIEEPIGVDMSASVPEFAHLASA
jgi:hypothetical protein